jgi:hypothetical protein
MFLALTALLTAPRSALCWAAKLKRFRECVEVVRNFSTNVSTAFHIGLSENRCGGPQPPSPFGRGLGVRRYGADLSKKCAPASRRDIVCQEFGLRRQAAQSKQSFSKSNVDGLIVREQVENLRQKRTEFRAQHCRRISKRSQHLLPKGKSGACHSRVISRSCNCRAFTAALSPQRGDKRNRDEIDNHEFCFALVARVTQPSRSPMTQLRVS